MGLTNELIGKSLQLWSPKMLLLDVRVVLSPWSEDPINEDINDSQSEGFPWNNKALILGSDFNFMLLNLMRSVVITFIINRARREHRSVTLTNAHVSIGR